MFLKIVFYKKVEKELELFSEIFVIILKKIDWETHFSTRGKNLPAWSEINNHKEIILIIPIHIDYVSKKSRYNIYS